MQAATYYTAAQNSVAIIHNHGEQVFQCCINPDISACMQGDFAQALIEGVAPQLDGMTPSVFPLHCVI